jgi:hypothetical protein
MSSSPEKRSELINAIEQQIERLLLSEEISEEKKILLLADALQKAILGTTFTVPGKV